MALYIDASALVSLIIVEPDTHWAQAFIVAAAQDRLISDFAAAEVASALSKRVRTGHTTSAEASELLVEFDSWSASDALRVETTAADVAEAARLVRRFELRLRAPDALHLALATRHDAELVTRDLNMMRAARMTGLSVVAPA